MNFIKTPKRKFSKFVYRQNFEIFGHKLTLENMNTRKQLAVKLYKLYYRFLDIKKIFKSTKQFKIIKMLLLSEVLFYTGKIYLEISQAETHNKTTNYDDLENSLLNDQSKTKTNSDIEQSNNRIPKKDLLKSNISNYFEEREKIINRDDIQVVKCLIKDPNSSFYRSNVVDLGVNLFLISYLGKYLNIVNPRAFKAIALTAIISNLGCLYANEKIKTFVMKKTEIKNFNVFQDTSILSKMLISYSFFAFFDKVLANKKIGFDVIKVNRKPIFMLFNLFFLAKLTNFLSIYTCDAINLTTPDGIIASFTALMILNPLYLPLFTFAFYINPYSYYIWFSGKNKLKDEQIKEVYGKKKIQDRFFTYLKYVSLSNFFYGMNVYF